MKSIGGYFWPDADVHCAQAVLREVKEHFPYLLRYIPSRETAIQAGGNVGVYATTLSDLFDKVLTFEPDPENFALLKLNTEAIPNIRAYNAALGAEPGTVGMVRTPENAGAHRVQGDGQILMRTIDGLNLNNCSLIYLDIEGHEPYALEGASKTIQAFSPTIIIENKPAFETFEVAPEMLRRIGYRLVSTVCNDFVFVRP